MMTNLIRALAERHPRLQIGQAPGCVDIPPGWLDLVDDVARQIEALLPAEVVFATLQIQEKGDGRIRWLFNLDPVPDDWQRILDLVLVAEQRSGETCAVCGSPGGPGTVGRVTTTLCAEHGRQYQAGRPLEELHVQGWGLALGRWELREKPGALRNMKDL